MPPPGKATDATDVRLTGPSGETCSEDESVNTLSQRPLASGGTGLRRDSQPDSQAHERRCEMWTLVDWPSDRVEGVDPCGKPASDYGSEGWGFDSLRAR
jgi:hypothetical protein